MRETDLSQRGALRVESLVEYIDELWDRECGQLPETWWRLVKKRATALGSVNSPLDCTHVRRSMTQLGANLSSFSQSWYFAVPDSELQNIDSPALSRRGLGPGPTDISKRRYPSILSPRGDSIVCDAQQMITTPGVLGKEREPEGLSSVIWKVGEPTAWTSRAFDFVF